MIKASKKSYKWGLKYLKKEKTIAFKGAKYSVDPNTGHSLTENDFDLWGRFMPYQGKLMITIKIRPGDDKMLCIINIYLHVKVF